MQPAVFLYQASFRAEAPLVNALFGGVAASGASWNGELPNSIYHAGFAYPLPAAGSYVVVVTQANFNSGLAYTLSLQDCVLVGG